ncbi:MAG: FtsX-like permease family protein [Pseudomonadota bacterium]|nr:FtsX-like permease family protein [Pseudomonadota bacterium]
MPVLLRASLRYLARHQWQSWLSVIGIALGVAVVVAVDVANQSARQAFQLSLERIAGRATHQIESATGTIPEALYVRLRLEGGLRPAAPVIEGTVRIAGRTFTLLGIDPFASLPFQQGGVGVDPTSVTRLLTRPGGLLLGETDAGELGVEAGTALTLKAGGHAREATLAGIVRGEDRASLDGLAITDIASAQELLGRLGTIDRIDLILIDGQATSLEKRLPPGLMLVSAQRRSQALSQMTRAFHTNLTAMSLLALFVGGFIIYNTMTFAVLRRRPLLGTLRTLGVTRAGLFRLVLLEALAFSLIGTLIGVAAGIAAGWGLLQLVARTINDLYFALTVSELFLSPWALIKGGGLGVLVTLLAALGPAVEAATAQPRDVLRRNRIEQQGKRALPWLSLFGIGLMLAGLAVVQIPSRSVAVGFVALFLVMIGFSLCVPLVLRGLVSFLTPLLGRIAGPQGQLAARGITASISRTGIAVAALTVAVSATVGVGIMIDSFRGSVASWLQSTLRSDLYVSAPSSPAGGEGVSLPPGIGRAIREIPEVAETSMGRSARVEATSGQVALLALESSSQSHRGFRFRGDGADELWPRFEAGELILISEPYAYHQGLGTGERVTLLTTQGWRDFEIGGLFLDYGSDSGMLVLQRAAYARLWKDPGVSTIGVVLAADAPIGDALERIRRVAANYDTAIQVRANRTIREQSLEIFDRTFLITRVLRLLAVGVAFVGVLSALLALQMERAREYAILRATGVTRGQLLRLILLQTSLMGLAAGLLALPLGWIMGDLLIQVINLRSFGWTMEMTLAGTVPLTGLAIAWAAAVLAGLYPAYKVARTDPAAALRAE